MNSNGNMTFQLIHVFVSISCNHAMNALVQFKLYFLPTGEKHGDVSTHHSCLNHQANKEERNECIALHDHQLIKKMLFMLTCLQHNVHILHLNAQQGTPSHLQHPPMFMQLHQNRMFISHGLFFFFQFKIHSRSSSIFECKIFL